MPSKTDHSPTAIPYRDLSYSLVGSLLIGHFIISLNNDPFLTLIFRPWYYIELAIVSLIVFGVWRYVRYVTLRLDRHAPWEESPGRRIFLQLSLGVGLASLMALVLAVLYFQLVLRHDIRQSSFFSYEYPISILINLLFNAYYFSYYHYQLSRRQREELARARPAAMTTITSAGTADNNTPSVLLVSQGADQVPIRLQDLRLLHKQGDLVYLYLEHGEPYLTQQTLDELQARLPTEHFFRANRQAIVHRQACRSFQPIEYGKLRVDTAYEALVISQKRAPAFRKWITEE